MSYIPKFLEGFAFLEQPFNKTGHPTITTSILATLLPNKPLKKEQLLTKIGKEHTGKSLGYLSNIFSALSKSGVLSFDKRSCSRTWSQGENYKEYMGYIFMIMLQLDPKAVDSLQYRLMPPKDSQAIDFISSPDEDIFNKPNPYLELSQVS